MSRINLQESTSPTIQGARIPQTNKPFIHIEPSKGWIPLRLGELWQYRELLYFFVWRDLKIRYKQTIMGASWAILQPLFTMVIFSLFFGRLAKIPSDGIPYPIFSFTALVPWTFFSNGILQASNSLIINSNMIKKIYFPRLTMPTAAVIAGVVDFVLAFFVLLVMVFVLNLIPSYNYNLDISINILYLPLFLLLAFITTLGVSYWLSAMNAQFRDVRYIVPFIIQAWLFITPIAYPSSLLSQPWKTIYGLNPMAGVVEGFRWTLLGTGTAPGSMIFVSAAAAIILLVSGVYYFRKIDTTLADVL
jgi:lipopolysaccharide transport system permease protein